MSDPTLTTLAFLGAAAYVAGWIDAVVGGGGLVQLPALLIGLPGASPAQLLATNKFGSIFGTATSSVTFYRRVRPGGPGWEPIKAAAGNLEAPTESLGMQFYNWILGCTLIYATLFGIGKIIFKEWLAGLAFIAVAVVAGALISLNLAWADWDEPPISD